MSLRGVTGAGLATLAAGLQAHKPELPGGAGMVVGIDRFMSEARAWTNFTGNAVATLLIGTWVRQIDGDQVSHLARPTAFAGGRFRAFWTANLRLLPEGQGSDRPQCQVPPNTVSGPVALVKAGTALDFQRQVNHRHRKCG